VNKILHVCNVARKSLSITQYLHKIYKFVSKRPHMVGDWINYRCVICIANPPSSQSLYKKNISQINILQEQVMMSC